MVIKARGIEMIIGDHSDVEEMLLFLKKKKKDFLFCIIKSLPKRNIIESVDNNRKLEQQEKKKEFCLNELSPNTAGWV